MKKTWKKLLISAMALVLSVACVFGLIACGDKDYDETAVTKFYTDNGARGAVVATNNGGFVAETAGYYYVINGIGASSADNNFGVPVKGALVAVSKKDLSKSCVVVPKLFVASDYNAGVYIHGDYAYYGSPSTEKNPDGEIASNEMTFARTKLDGTDTKTFFTVDSLSNEYRFVEAGGKVFIIYFDAENNALVSYNTADGAKTDIAKKDEKTTTKESLNTYKFANDGTVVYTVTVYDEDFNQAMKDDLGDSYSRGTESYNKVYAYKQGAAVKCVLDGKKDSTGNDRVLEENYTISFVNNNLVVYTYTKGGGSITHTGMFNTADLTAKEVKNPTYATADALIVSESEVYMKNSEGTKLVKSSLVATDADAKQNVAVVSTLGKLLFKDGNFVYYINASNNLARIDVTVTDGVEQRVSEDTIATDWYAPELIVDATNGNMIFYIDNSTDGMSYAKYINLKTATVETETDDDGEVTLTYLKGNVSVGKMTKEDGAKVVENQITALSTDVGSKFAYDTDENDKELSTITEAEKIVKDARKAYDALGEDKELVSEDTVKILERYEYALGLANKMIKLYGFERDMTKAEKDAFRADFDKVTAALEELKNNENCDAQSIRDMMPTNLNWCYQELDKHFNPEN